MSASNAWPPHITVATVVQRNNEYLFVEERDAGQTVFNQPAGHLEPNETLFEAAVRETLEETAWDVHLTGLIGLYHYYSAHNDTTYLRICFAAEPLKQQTRSLDSDIIAAHWLRPEALNDLPLRSPLVTQCLQDSINKPLIPLETVKHLS